MAICNNKKCSPGECNQAEICPGYVPVVTNGDHIRSMSDAELANFMAEKSVNESTLLLLNGNHGLTAVQIEAIKYRMHCAFLQWLKQPAKGENA